MITGMESIDRRYLVLIGFCLLVSVPVVLVVIAYMITLHAGTHFLWETLPEQLPIPRPLLTIGIATLGGFLVGYTVSKFNARPHSSLKEELDETGAVSLPNFFAYFLASIFSLLSGASLGPEGPIAHIGGDIARRIGEKYKLAKERLRIVSLAGIAAGFGGLIGPSLASGFMTLEFTGQLTRSFYTHLIATILAAIVGSYIVGSVLDYSLINLFQLEPLPTVGITYGLYAVLFGFLGILAAFAFKYINQLTKKSVEYLPSNTIVRTTLVGAMVGVVGVFLPLTLFSGEHQLGEIISTAGEIGIFVLLLLAIVKLVLLCLCMATGYPGGFIFPVLFSAGTVGVALHLLFPFIPLTLALACLMTALATAIMRMPLSAIFLVGIVTQIELIPLITLSAITTYILALVLSDTDAREVYAKNHS